MAVAGFEPKSRKSMPFWLRSDKVKFVHSKGFTPTDLLVIIHIANQLNLIICDAVFKNHLQQEG